MINPNDFPTAESYKCAELEHRVDQLERFVISLSSMLIWSSLPEEDRRMISQLSESFFNSLTGDLDPARLFTKFEDTSIELEQQ